MDKLRNEFVEFSLYIAWGFGNICGITGFWIVLLGYASEYQVGWVPLRLTFIASVVSGVLSIFGVILTVAAIWAPPNPRPPDKATKKYTAPAIVFICGFSCAFWLYTGGLNQNILNGIALIGVAMAVLRLLSQKPR